MNFKDIQQFKVFRVLLLFVFLTAVNSGCESDPQEGPSDYRDRFTGSYSFTRSDYRRYNFFWESPPHDSIINDTLHCIGTVEKLDSFRLRIVFDSAYTAPDFSFKTFPISINGLVFPVVSDSGYLSYPECQYPFFGMFYSGDSVCFWYTFTAHIGRQEEIIWGRKLD